MKTRSIKPIMMSLQLLLILVLFTSACGQTEEKAEATLTLNTPEASGQSDSNSLSDSTSQNDIKEDIHMAIISGKKDVVEQHIKAGTDINQKEQMSGSTPLLTAITFNKTAIAELLIKSGTDLSIKNNEVFQVECQNKRIERLNKKLGLYFKKGNSLKKILRNVKNLMP